MTHSFDVQAFNEPVYKQILGLAEQESISDWYALLGVKKFESDNAKIAHAMQQRYELVHRYKVGKYEVQAQRLIDELGRARACLTNERERRKYDETLAGRTGDAFTDAIEAVLLNDSAFDAEHDLRPSDRKRDTKQSGIETAGVDQVSDTGAIESDVNAGQELRRFRRKPDATGQSRSRKSSKPSPKKAARADRFVFRIPDWRGVDGTSVLPPLVLLIVLIGGMVVMTRSQHGEFMERAQTAQSQVEELRAEAASLRLTSVNSASIANGEGYWKEGTAALQANRPLEARKALELAARHYSQAIEAENRRVKLGGHNRR